MTYSLKLVRCRLEVLAVADAVETAAGPELRCECRSVAAATLLRQRLYALKRALRREGMLTAQYWNFLEAVLSIQGRTLVVRRRREGYHD